MSGTGQKRQLKQMMSNLHEMLKLLGQQDGSKFIIKIDQFEYIRRDFIKAAQQYQKAQNILPNTADKKQRGLLNYTIMENRNIMDKSLKSMINICLKTNQKIKLNTHKNNKNKQKQQQSNIQQDLQYKNLTIYQLQNTYFKLTKKQSKTSKKPNQNYPDQQTLQQLKLKKPLKRGYSQQTDPQSQQYLKQKQILQAIKHIDNRIQQKMDYILDGLRMLNYNAITISQSIGVIHNKILINVQNIQQNLQHMDQAQKLLQQASPLVSKPNCILNVIIVILLGVLVYFIVKKVLGDAASNIIG